MRLLYVVTEDWYFLSHRLPMARAARDAGFEVHVATRVVDGGDAIRAEGFTLHPVPFVRGRISPFGSIATVLALRAIHRAIDPAIAHHVSLQSAVLGSLAALGRGTSAVNALTGLGYALISRSLKATLLRPLMGILLRLLLNRDGQVVLVQNADDRDGVLALGIDAKRIANSPYAHTRCRGLSPDG